MNNVNGVQDVYVSKRNGVRKTIKLDFVAIGIWMAVFVGRGLDIIYPNAGLKTLLTLPVGVIVGLIVAFVVKKNKKRNVNAIEIMDNNTRAKKLYLTQYVTLVLGMVSSFVLYFMTNIEFDVIYSISGLIITLIIFVINTIKYYLEV